MVPTILSGPGFMGGLTVNVSLCVNLIVAFLRSQWAHVHPALPCRMQRGIAYNDFQRAFSEHLKVLSSQVATTWRDRGVSLYLFIDNTATLLVISVCMVGTRETTLANFVLVWLIPPTTTTIPFPIGLRGFTLFQSFPTQYKSILGILNINKLHKSPPLPLPNVNKFV